MEKLSQSQIEQFLKIEKEVVSSADHIEISDYVSPWDEVEIMGTVTLTTSMTTGGRI